MSTNKETIRLYWQQSRKHPVSFFIMLIFIPVGALIIDTLLPYVLSMAIGAMAEGRFDQLQPLLITGALVGLVGAVLNFTGFQAMANHESYVLAKERESTFATLMRKDYSFFTNQKIGAMTSRYIDFVRNHITIQDLFIIRTLGFLLSVGGGIVLLAFQSWLVAACAFGFILLLVLEIRWSTKKRAPWRHERKTLVGEIHGAVADALTNNLIVKSFAAEEREISHLNSYSKRFSKIYQKDIGFVTAEGSTRVALMIAVQVAVIALAAHLVQQAALSIAAAIFMLAYLQRIGSQLFVLGDIIHGYDQALLDSAPMTEMLLEQSQVTDKPEASRLRLDTPTISLEHVSYRYEGNSDDVLRDINLNIPAGQKVGMVGHSGAGKSTIVQLLLRFSDVTRGAITISGYDLRDVTQTSVRAHIAYVPQEPLLFHRTLRENIAYGNPTATEAEVVQAARLAHAMEFIEKLPEGLETPVGERGIKLSGGQRQRIAIARAILKDAPILILDEATSALDSESERLIQSSFDNLMKNRTSIVIAHRLSTIQKMDRIIVLDNGKIIEDGTHHELLARGGTYASLWAHQSGGFIEE